MPIALRSDFDAKMVRSAASLEGWAAGAAPALAPIYYGGSRREAARTCGVTLQIVHDWLLKFNADGPPGLIHRKAPCQPRYETHRMGSQEHRELSCPAIHGVVR